jgi:predicted metal-dependent HD superfamily phosphohydrolase
MADLLHRWLALGGRVGADPDRIEAVGRELLERWSQGHRQYHDPAHLTLMLDVVDAHAEAAPNPDTVRLAAWFHDAVYDPRAKDNEEASAELSVTVLTDLGVPPAIVAETARLVRLTASHAADPADADGALLCDADLAVLAGSPADYDAYAAAVRREYAHVGDAAFRAGRAAVLRQLLALPRLYRLLTEREPAARANLARELAALGPAARLGGRVIGAVRGGGGGRGGAGASGGADRRP